MQQVFFEVTLPLIGSILMLSVSFLLGNFILEKIKINDRYGALFNFGLSSILGYGLIANLSLLLSLANLLNSITARTIAIIILIVGRKKLSKLLKQAAFFLKNFKAGDFLEKLLIFIIASGFIFYLASTFSPPYTNDAIGYHLPNMLQIANGNLISMGGLGKWTENMPVLLETLYAWLYRMGGFNLINLCHYQITILLFVTIYCLIKKEFNRMAALATVALFFGFHPVLTHAVDSYTYGGLLSFELSGVLLFFIWVKYQESEWLALSGAMLGFALASKYTPLYTVLIMTMLFLFFSYRNKINKKMFIRNSLYFFGPMLLFAGFWYLKNLIIFQNPFYPFIFGHQGVDEKMFATFKYDSYYGLGYPFVKSTLANFLLLPFKLFWNPYYSSLLLSFLLFPVAFIITENKEFLRRLMFFAVAYLALWFFAISHVVVYGLLAPACFILVGGITFAWLAQKKLNNVTESLIFKILIIGSLVFFSIFLLNYKNNRVISLKINEFKYALGLINKEEFYHQNQLGELYDISNYVSDNYADKKIINNWDNFNIFLNKGNKFVSLNDFIIQNNKATALDFCEYTKENNITLVYINSNYRNRVVGDEWNRANHPNDNTQVELKNLEERVIEPNSKVIYEKYSGKLYQINLCNNKKL